LRLQAFGIVWAKDWGLEIKTPLIEKGVIRGVSLNYFNAVKAFGYPAGCQCEIIDC